MTNNAAADARAADARAAVAQGDLFDPAEHRHSGVLVAAIEAAIEAAQLDARDKGMGQLAVECARAVDVATRRRDPYAVAAAARELRETLVRLQLDPTARGEGNRDGGFDAWLRGITEPAMGDTAQS